MMQLWYKLEDIFQESGGFFQRSRRHFARVLVLYTQKFPKHSASSLAYRSSGVAFVVEMWRNNGSGFNKRASFLFDRWAQTGGQRMWQWQLQGRSTDLISLESLSLVLQACLLSPLHLLLLLFVSLQIEFLVTLVPGLVSGREEGETVGRSTKGCDKCGESNKWGRWWCVCC